MAATGLNGGAQLRPREGKPRDTVERAFDMAPAPLWNDRDSAIRWHLSASIAEAACLTRLERRVLMLLYQYYNKDSKTIDYPGDAQFCTRHHVPRRKLVEALLGLEKGGFILPYRSDIGSAGYFSNAMLLEEAYQRAKRAYPELFAS